MGQKESTPALRLSSQKPRRSIQTHTNIKAIKVVARCEELAIEVNESSMTCGWLLSEVIRAYKGEGSIVALKTNLVLVVRAKVLHLDREGAPHEIQ